MLAAGDLDSHFGTGGVRVYLDATPAVGMALQPGGKILILRDGGTTIERFNADGSRDRSFGSNGQVSTQIHAIGIATTADGKIVLGGDDGYGGAAARHWVAARLNADGSPDAGFNGTDSFSGDAMDYRVVGRGRFDHAGAPDWFALEPDGQVLLAGLIDAVDPTPPSPDDSPYTGETEDLDVVRLNADGTLDRSFGQQGDANTTDSSWSPGVPLGPMLVRPNGEVVVTGLNKPGIEGASGHQSVFAADGRWLSSRYVSSGPYVNSVAAAVRSDGKVVMATEQFLGYRETSLDVEGVAVPFGFNDPIVGSFPGGSGSAGVFGSIGTAVAVGDKVVFATGGGTRLGVARVNPDGSPDVTFGFGGTTAVRVDPYHDGWLSKQSMNAMAVAADGSIVAAGSFRGHLLLMRFAGGAHAAGTGAPRATFVPTYTGDDQQSYTDPVRLSVQYFGDNPIDPSTLDDRDIVVTGPNGYSATGKAGEMYPTPNRTPVGLEYEIPNPGSSKAAVGTYTVRVVAGEVRDTAGRAVPGGVIGTFTFPTVVTENPPPAGQSFSANVVAPYGVRYDRHFMSFQVRYDATAGVELASLGDSNFQVERDDGSVVAARLFSVENSDDGRTCVATYRVGAPGGGLWGDADQTDGAYASLATGEYAIRLNESPRDRAGHTLDDYAANFLPEVAGNFAVGNGRQPAARLEGIDAPGADGRVTFRVRFTPGSGEMDLSSLQSQAVSVDGMSLVPFQDPKAARLEKTERQADGSVVATYSAPDLGTAGGRFAIRVAGPSTDYSTKEPLGARDSAGTGVAGGLIGTFDTTYARRRPAVTLRSTQAEASPRRYVTFRIAYSSFNGIDPATLGDGDVVVTGPAGFAAVGRFAGVDSTGVASYFVRVPAGSGGTYRASMSPRAVRDVFGRAVAGGELGEVLVTVATGRAVAVAHRIGMAQASARSWLASRDDLLEWRRT
jgi:uncharacterized delta-60 repeat protein